MNDGELAAVYVARTGTDNGETHPVPFPVRTFAENVLPPLNDVPVAGNGCPLPSVEGIAWELNRRGGWEAWEAPEGESGPRKSKTYLGYFGKRELAKWEQQPEAQRAATVAAWIAEKRAKKGL